MKGSFAMIRTLAACLTVVGLLLAFTTENPTLTAIGLVLLGIGGLVVIKHPEWTEE